MPCLLVYDINLVIEHKAFHVTVVRDSNKSAIIGCSETNYIPYERSISLLSDDMLHVQFG